MTEPDLTEAEQDRAFIRALFAPDPEDRDEPDEQQKPPVGNFVPREGNTPKPPAGDGMREFIRDLFDIPD